MRLILSMLAAAALTASSAASAATFTYSYVLSRDGETLTGKGTLATNDGVQRSDGTYYEVIGVTGDVIFRYGQESRTANAVNVFGIDAPYVSLLDAGGFAAKFAIVYDDVPSFIYFDSDQPVAFVTEALFDVDSFNLALAPGVPEPATWALAITGFGLAGVQLRRRRPAAAPVLSA